MINQLFGNLPHLYYTLKDQKIKDFNDKCMSLKPGTASLHFSSKGTAINGPHHMKMLKNKMVTHMTVYDCSVFMDDGLRGTDQRL